MAVVSKGFLWRFAPNIFLEAHRFRNFAERNSENDVPLKRKFCRQRRQNNFPYQQYHLTRPHREKIYATGLLNILIVEKEIFKNNILL
jgi:hypothetical protein